MRESYVNEDGTVEIEGRKMRYIDPLTDWGFKRLFEAARIAAFTREELDEYTNDMMTENDRRNAIDYARKQGLEEGLAKGVLAGRAEGRAGGILEGRAEGLAEGRTEGEKAGKLSVAQRMLAAGLDPKMISEMTGLPEPEIRGL